MARKGVLEEVDSAPDASLDHLVEKYAPHIKKLKATYINDAGYHRPQKLMAEGRREHHETGENIGTHKVGNKDGHKGRGPGSWFFWDQGLHDVLGIPQENISMLQILEKPWLFNTPARIANSHKAEPNVTELDPEDEKAYFAALQLTQDAYDALKEDPPKVGAGQAGGTLPGCPTSGRNCANELAEISTRLNEKYEAALNKWCDEFIDGADMVVGQGGEVVMLNMAWQCNQAVADRLVDAVRANKCVYAGLSASTMVCAKSMEMTGEIQPGWIEAFACDTKYLSRKHFDENDLDGDGTQGCHLGGLPLIEAPLAMRPHYSESWEAAVLEKNLLAEAEFEKETGMEVCDTLVKSSNEGCEQGCKLLTLISNAAKDQDNPVFVPIRNGKVIEVSIHPQGEKGRPHHTVKENFHCIN